MMRWYLALGLALAAVLPAAANYMVIRIVLGNPVAAPGAAPGAPGLPGYPGAGAPGGDDGGALAGGAGRGMPGGALAGGAGRGMPGAGGVPPGYPGAGMPGGALAGGAGRGMPGGAAPPGYPGAGGVPPGFPGAGMPGTAGRPPAPGAEKPKVPFDAKTMLMAVVRLDGKPVNANLAGKQFLQVAHEFGGKTYLYSDSRILIDPIAKATIPDQWKLRQQNLAKGRTYDRVYEEAEWALAHGLPEECGRLLGELAKAAETPATKAKMSPKLQAAADAYAKVKPALSREAADPAGVDEWLGRLAYNQVARSPHYLALHNAQSATTPELERKLKMLEANREGFFLWFALRGRALEVPAQRLLVVIGDKQEDFNAARNALAEPNAELPTDSFLAGRENVLVYAPHRLDDAYVNFMEETRQIELADGWRLDQLLQGKVPKTKQGVASTADDVARAQTLALLERALVQESEHAVASHEGTRQLLTAVGLTPRHVELPEWLDFGTGGFFETPKGPFPNDSNIKVALWRTTGAPSWAYTRRFREMNRAKFGKPPAELLKDVVTDTLFAKAREPLSKDEQKPESRAAAAAGREADLARARTLSWSLTYFLMRGDFQKSDNLARLESYAAELSALPRDLEFDANAKFETFCKGVGLVKNGKVDPSAVRSFADEWLKFIQTQKPPGDEITLDDSQLSVPTFLTGGAGMPGMPGYPGMPGAPGAPGGGGGGSGID